MAESSIVHEKAFIRNAYVIGMESVAVGTAAETLATAGATIPAKTTQLVFMPAAAMRSNIGTPTTTAGKLHRAAEPYVFDHHEIDRTLFKTVSGAADVTCLLMYLGYN